MVILGLVSYTNMVHYHHIFSKLAFVFAGIISALIFSIFIDKFIGFYLQKTGYFKAMQSNVTEVYQTLEFNVVAKISSQGLRNEEIIIPKPKEVFRILALGDSFTFGWGVELEDSWPKQLEKRLREKEQPAYRQAEVINAGAYGANLKQEAKICKSYSSQLDIDLIILGLYSTEDLYQAASITERSKDTDNLITTLWPNIISSKESIIVKEDYFANSGDAIYLKPLWKSKVKVLAQRRPEFFSNLDPEVQKQLQSGELNPGLAFISSYDPDFLIRLLNDEDKDYALAALDNLFKNIKDGCKRNIPIVVLFLPSSELISKEFFPYKKDLGYNVSEDLLRLSLDRQIKILTDKHGFEFRSLLEDFRDDNCFECFYKYDMHLTPLGNGRVAEYLAPKISAIMKR